MSVEEHQAAAPERVGCYVITVSDSRDETSDVSGGLIKELLETNFHYLHGYEIVQDEAQQIVDALNRAIGNAEVQVILISGGTGIAKRDKTFDTLAKLLETRMDGFGELFRKLSYEDIGSAAMFSRAVAGVLRGKVVFSMPGDSSAVGLAMNELILPQIGHAVAEVCK